MAAETQIETQAERDLARFLASQPTLQQIIAFRLSPEVADRLYALIDADRDGRLADGERRELETYLQLEHLMRLVKAEAQRRLGQPGA